MKNEGFFVKDGLLCLKNGFVHGNRGLFMKIIFFVQTTGFFMKNGCFPGKRVFFIKHGFWCMKDRAFCTKIEVFS